MASLSWFQVHGAATHFPIVLIFVALGCDGLAAARWSTAAAPGLAVAGVCAIAGAAAGSLAAVVSGLYLSRGDMAGSGALAWHHRLVWPAFVLIVAAAAWRVTARNQLSRRSLAAYVAALALAAATVSAAGYFGGELLAAG